MLLPRLELRNTGVTPRVTLSNMREEMMKRRTHSLPNIVWPFILLCSKERGYEFEEKLLSKEETFKLVPTFTLFQSVHSKETKNKNC